MNRTFEQILEEDYHVQLEDNRRDESMKLAAEKYASQPSQGEGTIPSGQNGYSKYDLEQAYRSGVNEGGSAVGNFEWGITRKDVEFEEWFTKEFEPSTLPVKSSELYDKEDMEKAVDFGYRQNMLNGCINFSEQDQFIQSLNKK